MAPSDTTTCRSLLIFTLKTQRMYIRVWMTIWVSLCIEKDIFCLESSLSCLTYFSMLLGVDGDSDGEVRVLGKDDREMLSINSGKERGKTWESGGLSAPETTAVNDAGWNIWKSVSGTMEASHRLHKVQWDASRSSGPLGRWHFSNVRDPTDEIRRRLIVCLISSMRAHPHSPWWVKTNKILVICPTSSPGGEGWPPGCAWCHHPSPLRLWVPSSPMASCVGGGRPPPHNESLTCRLRSKVQRFVETNTGLWRLVWARTEMETVTLVSLCSLWDGMMCGVWAGWLFTSGFFSQRRRWVAASEGVSGVNNTFVAINTVKLKIELTCCSAASSLFRKFQLSASAFKFSSSNHTQASVKSVLDSF